MTGKHPRETPAPEAPEEAGPAVPAVEPTPSEPAEPVEDWATRFKYLFSDFENYRRRSEKDRTRARESGRTQVLRELLPLLEAFDRARDAARGLAPTHPLREGLDLVARERDAFLEREQVEPVARVGEPFKTEEHEAVAEVAPKGPVGDGMVAEVVQQGYRCASELLRPAKVVVARRPAPAPAPSTAPEADGTPE